jgi:anti-sigma regulatory factor (Ser/Thr protein kinase)
VTVRAAYSERFPSDLASVARARALVDRLRGLLPDDELRDARLLVSELVTNAVRHVPDDVPGGVELDIALDGTSLRVEVRDGGPGFRPQDLPARTPGMEAGSGWGLVILDRLARRWGADRTERSRVWFELDLDAGSRAG